MIHKKLYLVRLHPFDSTQCMDIDISAKNVSEALKIAKETYSGKEWAVKEVYEKVWDTNTPQPQNGTQVNVGDTVYFETFRYKNGTQNSIGIQPHTVSRVYNMICVGDPYKAGLDGYCEIPEWAIGKDVFQSEEEAKIYMEGRHK